MKPAKFDYFAPESVAEALELLRAHGGDAKILAGGQSLMPVMNFRLARPAAIIDINNIGELAFIREDGEGVAIGALTRQRAIERSDLVRRRTPLLAEATQFIGHLPIRSRGTIGGSLANADPAAEDPALALALDATMVLASHRGERRVAARDFFTGLLETAIAEDELLTGIEFPATPAGEGWGFREISRRHGDFALAGVAARITVAEGRIAAAHLAACGVGPGPLPLVAAAAALAGQEPSDAAIDAAAECAAGEIDPMSDVHASAAYRRELVRAMTARALHDARERAA